MCPFWNQNSIKFCRLSQSVKTEMLKRYIDFYIVILKCYQTAIQYLGNVTLSLIVTPRHDTKLAMPISGFMQKPSSRQHPKRFIDIEYNLSVSVVPYNSSKHYFVILSLYTIVFNNSVHGRPFFALRTASTIEGISLYSFYEYHTISYNNLLLFQSFFLIVWRLFRFLFHNIPYFFYQS